MAGNASHAERMLTLLKSVNDEETRPLMEYFARHPDPKAIAELNRRIGTEYEEKSHMTLGLAAMGDPDVLSWARKTIRKGEHRWVPLYVVAISPLPDADRAAREIIKNSEIEDVLTLVQGYGKSRSPQRVTRLVEAFEARNRDLAVVDGVRSALESLLREGNLEAAEPLKKMPPLPEED